MKGWLGTLSLLAQAINMITFFLVTVTYKMSLLAGKIICVERTVLLLQKPLLYRTVGADIAELTGPVKLDELDSATLVNSICTVRG